jgi:hypothetical protein
MAQRDLDAALQLLADRAQYITGASGAAIALRRDGCNDMLCRASAGSNAPELGALLSTEFGLSGESVRTRQPLRCDDAERDARVNREVCRQLGIASVVVMPVVNDDQVLGVFELFSGKANAFGERDLSAVERLSEMVETAVRLAHAVEKLPEPLQEPETAAAEAEAQEGQFLNDLVVEEPEAPAPEAAEPRKDVVQKVVQAAPTEPNREVVAPPAGAVTDHAPAQLAGHETAPPEAARGQVASRATGSPQPASSQAASASSVPEPASPAPPVPPKKTLFWSAAPNLDGDATQPAESDQAHVPPVLRGLHKCVACGFPVSAGRMLCVECEEKKWRGQLRTTQAAARAAAAKAVASLRVSSPAPAPKPAGQAFAVAASSVVKPAAPAPSPTSTQAINTVQVSPASPVIEPKKETVPPTPAMEAPKPAVPVAPLPLSVQAAKTPAPELVLSAGLAPPQSWLSRNKYILGVLLIAGAAAAAFFLR